MASPISTRKPTLLFLILLTGSMGLKDVSVVIPPAASAGDTVILQCRYDLEGEPLYTVKWYKGQSEFFRYLPKELPNTQVFPLKGINVDLSKSNLNKVVLRNVQPEVSGRYRCEVSTDAPNFFTNIETGYMYVINPPEGDPEVGVEKVTYEVGETLRGNCTSPPSYPSLNLTWFINGENVNESFHQQIVDPTSVFEGRKTPRITVLGLEIDIKGEHFKSGKARLQCVATLFNIYRSKTEVVLEEERPRPRPSSVLGTRDTSSGATPLLGSITIAFFLIWEIIAR